MGRMLYQVPRDTSICVVLIVMLIYTKIFIAKTQMMAQNSVQWIELLCSFCVSLHSAAVLLRMCSTFWFLIILLTPTPAYLLIFTNEGLGMLLCLTSHRCRFLSVFQPPYNNPIVVMTQVFFKYQLWMTALDIKCSSFSVETDAEPVTMVPLKIMLCFVIFAVEKGQYKCSLALTFCPLALVMLNTLDQLILLEPFEFFFHPVWRISISNYI